MEKLAVRPDVPNNSEGNLNAGSFAEQLSALDEGIQPDVNTALNESISLQRAADSAQKRTDAVIRAYELRDQAEQAHLQGDDVTAHALLKQSRAMYDTYAKIRESQESKLTFDESLDQARQSYVALLTNRPLFRGSSAYREELATAEQAYNEAFVGKLASIMDLDPHHDKAPYAPKTGAEITQGATTLEHLAGNQMHMLVDQLAREGLYKQEIIDKHMEGRGAKRVFNAFKKSRGLRVAVGGVIWAGSIIAQNKGILPAGLEETVGDYATVVTPMLAGYFTGKEAIDATTEGIEGLTERRAMRRAVQELSTDVFKSDLALATIYSGIEHYHGKIKGRNAGETPEHALKAFGNVNKEFAKLQREGVRGGKPYTMEQIMPYVADIYLRREAELKVIISSENPQKAFLQFAQTVIEAESMQYTEKQRGNKTKKMLARALGVGLSVAINQGIGVTKEGVGRLRDLQKMSTQPEDWARAA